MVRVHSSRELCYAPRRFLRFPAHRYPGERRSLCEGAHSPETCDGCARFRLRPKTWHATLPYRVPARGKDSCESLHRNRRFHSRTIPLSVEVDEEIRRERENIRLRSGDPMNATLLGSFCSFFCDLRNWILSHHWLPLSLSS